MKKILYIYKFTNKTNGKTYIGQTNNIEKRKRSHKSEAFNMKSNGYKIPFHAAIRKYGWDNFDFEILEELDDSFGRDYLNEREIFFIAHYKSLIGQNGYNVSKGGNVYNRTFRQQVSLSKIFTVQEVKDIQSMLLEGYEYFEIKKKYPKLSDSFLSNINLGLNFKREDLKYPLTTLHTKFSKRIKEEIITDIKSGKPYAEISKKYGISTGYIAMINKGEKWHDDKVTYPLCLKGCSDGSWSKNAKYDLIFTNLSHAAIAYKYHKAKSTITALNVGRNRKDNRLVYPLGKNKEQNKKIWNTLF